MPDLDLVTSFCGIIIGSDAAGRFTHLATACAIGAGEWVTAWDAEEPPAEKLELLCARDGSVADITGWEVGDGIAGFLSKDLGGSLEVASPTAFAEHPLHKREPLWAVGFPNMIDHPSFRLAHGSLTPDRYFPYLCPWIIEGFLSLFTEYDGFLSGQYFSGMAGGPVLNADNEIVGILLGGEPGREHPPLAKFKRLA